MSYILGILGSPRIGGNADTLLDKALEGASSKGAKTEKIILNNLKIRPCQECEKVKDDGSCIVEDDFQAVYAKIMKADGVILASPVFFGSLSAQTKIMIDRFQCYWRYKYVLKSSRTVNTRPGCFICVEASERDSFLENAKSIAKNLFATIGLDYGKELLCKGMDKKESVISDPDCLKKAFDMGNGLLSLMEKK